MHIEGKKLVRGKSIYEKLAKLLVDAAKTESNQNSQNNDNNKKLEVVKIFSINETTGLVIVNVNYPNHILLHFIKVGVS